MRRFALFIVLVALPVPALAETLSCPQKLSVSKSHDARVPKGWEGFVDSTNTHYLLESVTLYSGHPKELASLVPDGSDKNSQWWMMIPDPRGYYLACAYTHSDRQLVHRIDPASEKCRVWYDEDSHLSDGRPSIKRVECR